MATTWCKVCNVSSDGPYCRYCGEENIPAFKECPKCKARILTFSKFCEQCGRPVQEEPGQTNKEEV